MLIFYILVLAVKYGSRRVNPVEGEEQVACSKADCRLEKKICLDTWSGEVGGDLLISRHRQEDRLVDADSQTHWHTHTQYCSSQHCSHTSGKRKNISYIDLSLLCVRQKSLSGSNLSRSASVARTNSMLFHPAAPCWRTQPPTGSPEGRLTDPAASNRLNALPCWNEMIWSCKA